ncbi:4273_t:CDS:1, partial [Gigaspora margarita]
EIVELKREKAEFLAKEARSMARIMELEQTIKESAENKKLRDVELDEGNAKRDAEIIELRSKIAKLEYIIEENRLKISRSEENYNNGSADNSEQIDLQCNDNSARMCMLTSNSDITSERIENSSDITSDDASYRTSCSSDTYQKKSSRSSTSPIETISSEEKKINDFLDR